MMLTACAILFFFNDTATTEIYTLSLHDALPISGRNASEARAGLESEVVDADPPAGGGRPRGQGRNRPAPVSIQDRKSTRLNSSHGYISYAVFCLKKKTGVPASLPLTSGRIYS